MTDRCYRVQLTYQQLQHLIALVDNARHDLEAQEGQQASVRWWMLDDLLELLLAASTVAD